MKSKALKTLEGFFPTPSFFFLFYSPSVFQ